MIFFIVIKFEYTKIQRFLFVVENYHVDTGSDIRGKRAQVKSHLCRGQCSASAGKIVIIKTTLLKIRYAVTILLL